MRYFTICFVLIIFSCNQEKYKEEFFLDGTLKTKVQIDERGLPNGLYEEYYNSGELRVKTNYLSGINIDTTFIYYKNGIIKEKGMLKKNLKTGWWVYYDSLGEMKNRNEYKIISDSIYKNQSIHYDKKGYVIDSISSFYNIQLPDTLKLGKNTGVLTYKSNFKPNIKYLYFIIDNRYSDSEVKKDTFIEEPDKTRFGVFAYKLGKQKVKGTIVEQLLYKKEISKDSSELKIKEHKKYFEKEIYVVKN